MTKDKVFHDKIAGVIFNDEKYRNYIVSVVAGALQLPKDLVQSNLKLISNRINANVNSKYSVADSMYDIEDGYVNIEITYRTDSDYKNKELRYLANLILRQVNVSQKDRMLKPVYQICINNFDILNKGEFIYRSYVMDNKYHIKRSNMIEIVDISIDYLRKLGYSEVEGMADDSLEKLLYILIGSKKEINKLSSNSESMKEVNKYLGKFTEEDWNKMLEDETESYVKDCIRREILDEVVLASRNRISVEDIAAITGLTVERVKEILSEAE